ncbi:MAG: ThuA domain-containing protein [Fimbriimonadaceae bacterium]
MIPPLFLSLPGKSETAKHIVFMSGDEEYRSEECLSQLARVMSKHHGFKCTVLYSVAPDGTIDPGVANNIPGMEQLKTADLLICMLRFRNLPDSQMAYFDDYVKSGKPIIGLRTATHAFKIPAGAKYHSYSWENQGGFGKQILGETWIAHHGDHLVESTRAIPRADHPILRGITNVWVPSDVYTVGKIDGTVLLDGQVLRGMSPTDPPLEGAKNNPMMPLAWLRTSPKVFTTTMGSGLDFLNEDLRRLIINASYWLLGREVPKRARADVVGKYEPSPIGFGKHLTGKRPGDF